MGQDNTQQHQDEPAALAASVLYSSLTRQNQELKRNLREHIASTRVSLCRPLRLRFPHFRGFLNECSSNISMTGMFVNTPDPEPPGTIVDFEFLLADGLRLIQGTAEVAWLRPEDETVDRPAGMGLRFLRLDAASRRLIRWTVEKQITEQGKLVELQGGNKYRPSNNDLHKLYPYAKSAAVHLKRGRRWMSLLAVAFAVTLATSGLLYSVQQPGAVPIPRSVGALTGLAGPAPTESAGATEQPADEGLLEAVSEWSRLSAEPHFGEYLLYYSPVLRPSLEAGGAPDGGAPDGGQAPPQVKLRTEFEAELVGPGRARVVFSRYLKSGAHQEIVRTTLDMALEDGQWKILDVLAEERTSPGSLDEPLSLGS